MTLKDIAQLIANCQQTDPQKQIATIETVGELKAMEAIPVLMHLLLTDPDPNVRSSAIYALNELQAVEAVPVLMHLLSTDPDPNVRASAAFILRFFSECQRPTYSIDHALLNASSDSDKSVRYNAVESLGYLNYLPAVNRIRELLHTDPAWFVRASAAEALGRMHDEVSIADLEQALTDPDPEVQRNVVIALGQFLDSSTLASFVAQHLIERQLAPVVRAELLALGYRLGQQSLLQDVLTILDQAEDYEVATQILMVLVELTGQKPPLHLKNQQVAIQASLQRLLQRYPSLQSDVKRVQEKLKQLASNTFFNQ